MRRIKVIPKEERCSEPSISDSTGWHVSQCLRRGTITEEGKPWCFQHAPSKTKARRAEAAVRYKADQDRRMAPYNEAQRLRAVNSKLLEALEGIGHEAAKRGTYAKTADETFEMSEDFETIEKLAIAAIEEARKCE